VSRLTAQAVAPAPPEPRAVASARGEPQGLALLAIVLILAAGNFLAVLDLTIANVLVPHIAGGLASSPSDGTWVITGYGVAEAIMVPLTGWLTERFGPVKVFVLCVAGFGVFSALCGMATSLGMLIAFRVALGVCGGPLIPISQTLLIAIVPKRHANAALAVWSMTSVLAPIAGPVIGGLIGDHWSWPWAFYFKTPLAAVIALGAWRILTPYETPTVKAAVDFAGLGLLVVWVAALQTMLGVGQDKDWFNSQFVVALLIVSLVGLAAFVIWETTDRKPIVDLSVFANRGFSVSMAVIAMAFGATFGSIVLVPLWLQTSMGYTATWAGCNSALGGVTMIIAAPVTTVLMARVDHRAVACVGLLISAAASLMRVGYNDQMTFWQLMWPQLAFGAGMVMSVIPLMAMSTSSLEEKDVASGAGLFNFIRTLASALSTAAIVALWNNQIRASGAILAGELQPRALLDAAAAAGMGHDKALNLLDLMVQGQSVMLATNRTFLIVGILQLATAAIVWVAPKPPKRAGGGKPPVL
jgi:DHA2 family multidrug resistance protein